MNRPLDLTVAEAAEWLAAEDRPTILDVRTPEEFADGHLTDAINVPVDLVEAEPDQIGRLLDGEVLFVCRTDRRAHRAAQALSGTLGERAHVMTNGMTQWTEEDRPVQTTTQDTPTIQGITAHLTKEN